MEYMQEVGRSVLGISLPELDSWGILWWIISTCTICTVCMFVNLFAIRNGKTSRSK